MHVISDTQRALCQINKMLPFEGIKHSNLEVSGSVPRSCHSEMELLFKCKIGRFDQN